MSDGETRSTDLLGTGGDVAAEFVSGDEAQSALDATAERRLLWKIDLLLMPLLTISFGLQYYDKAIFSSATLFGILSDMDLSVAIPNTNPPVVSLARYSSATAAFYWGYLVAAYPMAYILQRFPLGKTLALMVILWGVVVMLTVVVTSYPGIVAQRFFLGVVESSVSPGFVLVSSMWYKRDEQPARIGIWYSATGLFSIFSGVVNYGIGKGSQDAPLATWKYMYIFGGSWTIAWGILLFFTLPNNPVESWFLTLDERKHAVRRLQHNMTGVESKVFKRSQVVEALTDLKIYLFLLMGAALYVTNGGVTAFGAQIVKSFGYSSLQTILMLTPGGAVTAVSIYITGWITTWWKNSRTLLIPITCMPVLAGAVMIWKGNWTHRAIPLAGYYLLAVFGAPYVLLLSLSTANVAGHTKKAFSAAAIFVGYNVGNIIAPYMINTTTREQHYPEAWISVIVCMVFTTICSFLLRFMFIRENRRRGRLETNATEDMDDKGPQTPLGDARILAWGDLTDKENPQFRYAY